MPRPFAQTFNWLYSRLPFSDKARTRLRVWAEAIRQELLDLQTEADGVYDAIFITEADGTDLDEWGEVLELPRLPAESDAAYRAKLLLEWQSSFDALTVQAVTDTLDALGAGYVPVLCVDTVAEHYKDRLEDGTGAANDYDLGDRWGLARLDLSTFAVEIDRIPTPTEAEELVQAIGEVRPAQTRGFLVVPLPAPAGTPPRYRLYGTSYSDDVPPWLWDDNFEQPIDQASPLENTYQIINDGGSGSSWEYTPDGAKNVLYGDASDGAYGVPHLCLPRQDLNPVLLDYRDMYVECSLRVTGGASDTAGIALRYDDATGEFYYLAFRWSGTAWEYSFIYYDGAAMNTIINWTATGTAMDVYKTVQAWLENDLFTLIINEVVLENKTDIKRVGVLDIDGDGEFGFCTNGTARDIYVDWWRMW